jgi:8-oxo-dGTP diphosphatase
MNKQQLAAFLKRFPFIPPLMMSIYRWWQPHMTIGAVGAVFNSEGKLLIVEHVFHPVYPWGLPGGWAGRNEDPDQTVMREVWEETGLRINIVKPLAIMQTEFIKHHLDVAFLCELPDGEAEPAIKLSNELTAYKWIDPTNTPHMANFHHIVVERAIRERQL